MRSVALFLAVAVSVASAQAHFLFLVPPATGADTASIVWSDTPDADPQISTEALGKGVVKVLAADGIWTETAAATTKTEGVWRTVAVAKETKALVAEADYGLVNRGEGHVYFVKYAAKWERNAGANTKANLWLQLQSVRTATGMAFAVLQNGEPLANADVSVYEPSSGGKIRTVKTDAKGITPNFAGVGQYAARVMAFEASAGESEGRKYKGTYHYSTLVTDYRP